MNPPAAAGARVAAAVAAIAEARRNQKSAKAKKCDHGPIVTVPDPKFVSLLNNTDKKKESRDVPKMHGPHGSGQGEPRRRCRTTGRGVMRAGCGSAVAAG